MIMLFKISSCLLLLLFMIVRGDYILSVQVRSYDNPSSRCAGCRFQGCCDLPRIDNCGSLCDNEFFYCLRPWGTPNQSLQVIKDTVDERSVETRAAALQCMGSPAAVRTSQVDLDAARNIVFTGTEYLGINNPIMFVVPMEKWEGIQLYADAIDRDGPGDGDELIESFSIDLEPGRLAPDLNLESVNVSGRFGFASTVLSFQLECQPGESCVEICTTSSTATADATTTSSSSSSSVLAGAVGGSVVFIIIIIIIIAIVVSLVFVFLRQRVIPSFTKGTMDNPVYDTSGLPAGQEKDVERDLDNPIYGLEENTYDMPEGHLDTLYTSIDT